MIKSFFVVKKIKKLHVKLYDMLLFIFREFQSNKILSLDSNVTSINYLLDLID